MQTTPVSFHSISYNVNVLFYCISNAVTNYYDAIYFSFTRAMKDVEKFLANTEVSETSGIHTGSFMALVHKPPTSGHRGLSMSVSDSEVRQIL